MWKQKKASLPGFGKTFVSKEAWLKWCANELAERQKPDSEAYNFYVGETYVQRKMLGKIHFQRQRTKLACKRFAAK